MDGLRDKINLPAFVSGEGRRFKSNFRREILPALQIDVNIVFIQCSGKRPAVCTG